VAAKISAATAEALSNSVRHAGEVYRAMAVTVRPGMVEVEVRDDGPGFDPDRVGADRLGVSGSIIGRMSRLPGGYARIDSDRGRGTTVVLGWRG
jgi:signal transduction histidine kinase